MNFISSGLNPELMGGCPEVANKAYEPMWEVYIHIYGPHYETILYSVKHMFSIDSGWGGVIQVYLGEVMSADPAYLNPTQSENWSIQWVLKWR